MYHVTLIPHSHKDKNALKHFIHNGALRRTFEFLPTKKELENVMLSLIPLGDYTFTYVISSPMLGEILDSLYYYKRSSNRLYFAGHAVVELDELYQEERPNG